MLPAQLARDNCGPSLLLLLLCNEPSNVPQLNRRSLLPECTRGCCVMPPLPELSRW